MNLAIVTDSTTDLQEDELERLGILRVPLYVSFKGETYRDWLDIEPSAIIAGITAGADLPSTSQPSPEDFAAAYRAAVEKGADTILVVTLSSELSGTYQSAVAARDAVDVEVRVFDSRVASLGHGAMARTAARLRDRGASLEEIVAGLEHMRDNTFIVFTVASFDYLQKGGRIGRASALVGSLLNIKPILTLEEGLLAPLTRVRGMRKALQEMVDRFQAFVQDHPDGRISVDYIHVEDEAAVERLRGAVESAGIDATFSGSYRIGAVITSHVGPGTFGMIARSEPA